MDSGPALRASAISAFRSAIRYCSRGAMLGYSALALCPRACHAAHSKTTSVKPFALIVLRICRFMDFFRVDWILVRENTLILHSKPRLVGKGTTSVVPLRRRAYIRASAPEHAPRVRFGIFRSLVSRPASRENQRQL